MTTEIIDFLATDGAILNGYINKNEKQTDKILIEIHGMGSNCFKKRERIIAEEINKIGIDSICFNTRGSEIVRSIKYNTGAKKLAGTAYEDIEESYYDILGVIKYAVEKGYKSIYLQGHSLGSTKIVYTYNKMKKENNPNLKYIKGIILLSLVDIPDMIKTFANPEHIKYAEEKEKQNDILGLMPEGSFIHPISVKTFLKYAKYYKPIDFAQYDIQDNDFKVLNKIDIPLFMRWGNIQEMIKKDAKEHAQIINEKIKNQNKDINYIDGADHSYSGKEDLLASQIKSFLEKI